MCKAKSMIITKNEIYESAELNSHEEIKKEFHLKDFTADGLLIAELIPKDGVYICSTKREDWKLNLENKPAWFDEDAELYKDRIFNVLFNKVFLRWENEGITEELDLSNLDYKILPDFKKIKIQYLNCSNNQLTELSVPAGIQYLYCYNNQLKELSVPAGIQHLDCYNNQLKELSVPAGIQYLNCSNNQLTELIVPAGIQHLNCSYNQLKKLSVPAGIQYLNCYNNQLTELIVPAGIQYLDCYNNQLKELSVPAGIQYLYCDGNPDIKIIRNR